jgi:hypothetical protein
MPKSAIACSRICRIDLVAAVRCPSKICVVAPDGMSGLLQVGHFKGKSLLARRDVLGKWYIEGVRLTGMILLPVGRLVGAVVMRILSSRSFQGVTGLSVACTRRVQNISFIPVQSR